MVITRLTHRTDKTLTLPIRFDFPLSSADQYINYRTYLQAAGILKTKRVTGIAALISDGSFAQANTISDSQVKAYVVTVKNKRGEILLDKYPLHDLSLHYNKNQNKRPRRFDLQMDPDQSYIQLLDPAAATYLRGYTLQLLFWYTEK